MLAASSKLRLALSQSPAPIYCLANATRREIACFESTVTGSGPLVSVTQPTMAINRIGNSRLIMRWFALIVGLGLLLLFFTATRYVRQCSLALTTLPLRIARGNARRALFDH